MGYYGDVDQTSASNTGTIAIGDLTLTPHIHKKKGNPVGLPFVAIDCYYLTSSRGMSKYPSACHISKNCSNCSISGKLMSICCCSMIKFLLGLMVGLIANHVPIIAMTNHPVNRQSIKTLILFLLTIVLYCGIDNN